MSHKKVRGKKKHYYDYVDIAKITNLSEDCLRKRASRGEFNLADLMSVATFLVAEKLAKEAKRAISSTVPTTPL